MERRASPAITLMTSGVLTIADVDRPIELRGPSRHHGQQQLRTFTLGRRRATGAYSADNTQTAIQQLGRRPIDHRQLTGVSSRHRQPAITVTINGTTTCRCSVRAPRRGQRRQWSAGVAAITLMTSGVLTIADVDQANRTRVQAGTTGSNNTATHLAATATGATCADNTQTAIQQLGRRPSITDSFTAVSSDWHRQPADHVTINGHQRRAVARGVHLGAVSEDNGAAGRRRHHSADGPAACDHCRRGPGQFELRGPSRHTGSNNYGTFTLAADGHWSYSADNTQTAIQQLGAANRSQRQLHRVSPTAPPAS